MKEIARCDTCNKMGVIWNREYTHSNGVIVLCKVCSELRQ